MLTRKKIKKQAKNLTVLYVEDENIVREATCELLLNYFEHIDVAVDGEDGLTRYNDFFKVNNKFYDLIITDINMSKMSGIDMTKEMLKLNSQQDIIIVSAYNDSERLQKLMELGISNFVSKPITSIELTKFLEKAIKSIYLKIKEKDEFTKIQKLNHELDALVNSFDTYVIASRTDLKGRITYASKAYEIISGYKEEELIGKPHSIVRHPDMPSSAFKDMWQTIQSEKLWVGEVKNLKKDGSHYWVHSSVAPYYNEKGVHIGYSAIRIDITAQKQVEELNAQVNNLLNNSGEGFLSFGKEIKIHQSFSKECLNIFQKEDIYNENISNLLFANNPKEKKIFDDGILKIIENDDEMIRDLLVSLLPKEVSWHKRTISIKYKIIENNDFMLILTDITRTKELEAELLKQDQIQKMVVAVASNKNDFLELIYDFKSMMQNPSKDLVQLLRDLHTYKGIFAQKGMLHTPSAIHLLESKLNLEENISEIFSSHDLQTALDKDLEIISSMLGDEFLNSKPTLNIDRTMLENLESKIKKLDINSKDSGVEAILDDIEKFKNESIYTMLSTHPAALKSMAQRLEKEVYPLEISGDRNLAVSPRLKPFMKSLIHLFNNCVEHGIEDIETRLYLEKDEIGTITCNYFLDKNSLKLIISDDGAGINVEKLTKNAIKNKIDTTEYKNPLYLVFADKLSSKEKLSLSSGRGVGMSAIKHEVDELNGEIEIINKLGTGVEFIFTLPL